MFNSRFVTKIIASLALILLTLFGAGMVYGVFLQIKVALTAASYGCSRVEAMKMFADDVKYYTWLHGHPNLLTLHVIADTRLTAIRKEFQPEN